MPSEEEPPHILTQAKLGSCAACNTLAVLYPSGHNRDGTPQYKCEWCLAHPQ